MLVAVGRHPITDKPSSVKVPVLSNTTVEIYPAMFIRGGEIQKIECDLRRLRAKTTPQDIAAGRAGGTTTVIKSRVRSITDLIGTPSYNCKCMVEKLATIARHAIMPMNFIPSA